MKNKLLNVFYTLVCSLAFVCNCDAVEINKVLRTGNEPVPSPSTINNLDSVYFDVAQAIFNGNSVEFPVFFKSDDIVNALGFAFTFDETVLEYDTIIIVANYFDSPIFSYNALDSVVRFETFSIAQPIVNDTVLLKIRFNVLNGQMCDTQIDSTWTSLNGDVCSYSVLGCQTIGLQDNQLDDLINVYPNPASDIIYIDAPESTLVQMYDISGRKILEQEISNSTTKSTITTSEYEEGIYLIKLYYNEAVAVKKILIRK